VIVPYYFPDMNLFFFCNIILTEKDDFTTYVEFRDSHARDLILRGLRIQEIKLKFDFISFILWSTSATPINKFSQKRRYANVLMQNPSFRIRAVRHAHITYTRSL